MAQHYKTTATAYSKVVSVTVIR